MKLYYDFHIHTALSPCAEEKMTPNNIVNMSILNQLGCIAITDHNTCKNVQAVMEVGEKAGIIVIPGMELETSEEIHTICLFPGLNEALEFSEYVKRHINIIKHRPDVFGSQLYFDKDDNVVGECENMLITSTNIGIYEVTHIIKKFGGIVYPAHIDRHSYSILSNLGFIPKDLDINCIEFSKYANPEAYIFEHPELFGKNYFIIQSSDAHNLGDIGEKNRFLQLDQNPEIKHIIEKLLHN